MRHNKETATGRNIKITLKGFIIMSVSAYLRYKIFLAIYLDIGI